MSDHSAWLEPWCPECRAAPGARCHQWRCGRGLRERRVALPRLHVARGWLERPCPTCKAGPGERCWTPTGREAARAHSARLSPARWELAWRPAVWDELGRRGATVAVVPFRGRAGRDGHTGTITLLCLDSEEFAEVERWSGRGELCHELEAPVWERFGTFVGHPMVSGEVIWTVADRSVVIRGSRGERPFEELVR